MNSGLMFSLSLRKPGSRALSALNDLASVDFRLKYFCGFLSQYWMQGCNYLDNRFCPVFLFFFLLVMSHDDHLQSMAWFHETATARLTLRLLPAYAQQYGLSCHGVVYSLCTVYGSGPTQTEGRIICMSNALPTAATDCNRPPPVQAQFVLLHHK